MPERMAHVYEEKSYVLPAVLGITAIVAARAGAFYFYSQNLGRQYESVLEQLDA